METNEEGRIPRPVKLSVWIAYNFGTLQFSKIWQCLKGSKVKYVQAMQIRKPTLGQWHLERFPPKGQGVTANTAGKVNSAGKCQSFSCLCPGTCASFRACMEVVWSPDPWIGSSSCLGCGTWHGIALDFSVPHCPVPLIPFPSSNGELGK